MLAWVHCFNDIKKFWSALLKSVKRGEPQLNNHCILFSKHLAFILLQLKHTNHFWVHMFIYIIYDVIQPPTFLTDTWLFHWKMLLRKSTSTYVKRMLLLPCAIANFGNDDYLLKVVWWQFDESFQTTFQWDMNSTVDVNSIVLYSKLDYCINA